MAIDNKDKKILNVPPLRFPEFSGEWEMVSLQDIATINPKSDPLQNTFIYIDLEAVEKGELRKIQEIMREEAPSRAQRVIDNNDILFQCVRPYQKNNYIHRILNTSNQQWVASTGYAQIRTTELPNYIYHLLNTDEFNRKVMVRCTGSSYPAINSEDLATIHLYYTPDKKEQLKISRLLDLLDKRIATQNKIIDKLKSLIKGIDEVVFQSCSKHCKLKEFDNQITAGRDKVEEGCFPLYGSTGVIGTTATPSYHEPLVLVARVGSIGCVQFVNIPCGVSDNTIVIRCGSKAKYVYYYLQNYNFERITSGTTQPLITAKDVKHIDIPIIDSANDLKAINTLDTLNMKLELESNLYNTILKQKAFLLQQMFI